MDVFNAPNFAKGEKITKPGIYTGVPIEIYHGDPCDGPSISSGGLRTIFKESPADYWLTSPYNKDLDGDGNPMREERKVSEAMTLGQAAHILVLGEKHFAKSFTLRPAIVDGEPWQGNRKACKAWVAKAAADGKAVVTGEQIVKIKRMAAMLNREPLIKSGLMRGHIERSFFYRDKATGIYIKGRPDIQPNEADDFADYKTAAAIDNESLERSIADFGYYMQAGVIDLCWRAIVGRPVNTFNLIFQKSSAPHSVWVRELKASEIKAGAEDALLALSVFAHCLKAGEWFGPAGRTGDLKPLGRTQWALDNAAFRRKVLEQELKSWQTKAETPAGLA